MENNLRKNKIILTIVVAIASTAFFIYIIFFYVQQSLQASTAPVITEQSITEDSAVVRDTTTVLVDVGAKKNEYLYKARTSGKTAALEFLQRQPVAAADIVKPDPSVQGATSDTQSTFATGIVPSGFVENSVETRSFRDQDDPYLQAHNINLSSEHYCFNQLLPFNNKKINLYGGVLCIHIKNNNEVYAVNGSTSLSNTVEAANFSEDDAVSMAVEQATKRSENNASVTVINKERSIVNKKIIGISEDERNYPTLVVSIERTTKGSTGADRYFVNLSDGNLLFVDPIIKEAMNREIHAGACSQGGSCMSSASCPVVLSEGQPATGTSDAEKTYNYLGETYNFYKNTFSRDSYDNHGAKLTAYVTTQACNNAAWLTLSCRQMMVCKGMAGRDVLAHELTHAVTESTAGLIYQNQSGALNEAFSDIFGSAVDNTNWSIGEETVLGIIRYMDDPSKAYNGPYYSPQPDRLFSDKYKCVNPGTACVPGRPDNGGNDNCWVHANSGVFNHAYYLMVEGSNQSPNGKYNGCAIAGVGREKATAVMYRTLSANLTSSANFKAVYTAVLRSCSELYPNDTTTCDEIKKALQATEMDQQPDGQALGAKCTGQTAVAPACASGNQEPSTTLIPAEPTTPPTSGASPTRTPTVSPVPTTSVTPSPAAGQTNFTVKVKFQGISSIGVNQSIKINIRLISDSGQEYQANGSVTGTAGQAIWSGGFVTDAPAGEGYTFLVKGAKHLQKKICVDAPTEQYPGSYRCTTGNITLKKDGVYDLSGITLLVGDLPEQDGIVNAYDIGLIINNFGKRDSDILAKADVNMDGIVDTQDYSLVIAALSIRYDEE